MVQVSTEIDFLLPATRLLQVSTKKVHEDIENSEGAALLLGGKLDKAEYVRYLMMLWHIYSALETGLEKLANDPVLSHTYNPALLSRASRLSADISFLLGLPDDDISWRTSESHKCLLSSPPEALTNYTSRLIELRSQPSRLLAHSYVRYLGDLSGGQVIKYRLQKAYSLEEETRGLAFYDFEYNGEPASVGDTKKIKEGFKAGINAGIGEDKQLKELLVDEATRAFQMNTAIFNTLGSTALPETEAKWSPSAETLLQSTKSESTYSVTSVVAFMLAVGLAHFILVVGGFTGEKTELGLAQIWWSKLASHFD